MKKIISAFILLFSTAVLTAQPSPPTLIAPSNNATKQKANARLLWTTPVGAVRFHYQVDTVNTFNSAALLEDTITASQMYMNDQLFGKKYFWRVRAGNATVFGNWSSTYSYTVYEKPEVYSTGSNLLTSSIRVHQIIGAFVEYQMDTVNTFNSGAFRSFSSLYKDSASARYQNLHYNTKYYIRARAYHAKDTSPYTATTSHTTFGPLTVKPSIGSTVNNFNFDFQFGRTTATKDTVERVEFELDSSSNFNSPLLFTTVIDTTDILKSPASFPFLYGKTYHWRVRCLHAEDTSKWVQSRFTMFSFPMYNLSQVIGGRLNPSRPTITVTSGNGADYFIVMVDTVNTFANPIYTDTFSGVLNPAKQLPYLRYNRTHFFRVHAVRGTDTSASIIQQSTTIQSNALVTPYNWSVLSGVNETFWWQEIAGNNYEVEFDTTLAFNSWRKITRSGLTTDSTFIEGLAYGQKFYWRVRMTNPVDVSLWSAVREFTTKSYPAQLWPSDNQKDFIVKESLSCEVIDGTRLYEFYFSEDSLFNIYAVDTSTKVDMFGDIELPMGRNNLKYETKYFWKVRAIHSNDTSKWSPVWRFTTRKYLPPPVKPVLTSPANNVTGVPHTPYIVKLIWQLQADVEFEIHVAKNTNFNNLVLHGFTVGNTNNEMEIDSLEPRTTYYWRVRATNGDDTSAWSDVWKFTTLPAIRFPQLLSPDGVTNVSTNVTLDWEDIDGAKGYRYRLSTTPSFIGIPEVSVTQSEAQVNLLPNTNYYWIVLTYNDYFFTNYGFTAAFRTGNSTGIEGTSEVTTYSYPNPFSTEVVISSPDNTVQSIEFYNLQGQLCYSYTPANPALQNHTISGSNLAAGLYVVQVHTTNGLQTLRLIKE